MAIAAAAAATIARRTSSSLRLSFRPIISPSSSSSASISRLQRPISREALALSSMLPAHSAVASARLVSKLPTEANASSLGEVFVSCFCAASYVALIHQNIPNTHAHRT